jgi:hypothetical protein
MRQRHFLCISSCRLVLPLRIKPNYNLVAGRQQIRKFILSGTKHFTLQNFGAIAVGNLIALISVRAKRFDDNVCRAFTILVVDSPYVGSHDS